MQEVVGSSPIIRFYSESNTQQIEGFAGWMTRHQVPFLPRFLPGRLGNFGVRPSACISKLRTGAAVGRWRIRGLERVQPLGRTLDGTFLGLLDGVAVGCGGVPL